MAPRGNTSTSASRLRRSRLDPPDDPDRTTGAPAVSPEAQRPRRARWRDPRLVVGIAVIAVCGLLGARLLGSADDTVGVWAVRTPMAEGQPVTTADVVRRQIRFEDQADADRYVSADQDLPGGATLSRAVGAGELLPREALGSADDRELTEVPLSVPTEAVPATLRVGSVVDVYVTPDAAVSGSGADANPRSTLVFDDVTVLAAPRTGTALGPSATRQVIVGVGPDQTGRLPSALASLSAGTVVLTARR
jgi:hypothetical protein